MWNLCCLKLLCGGPSTDSWEMREVHPFLLLLAPPVRKCTFELKHSDRVNQLFVMSRGGHVFRRIATYFEMACVHYTRGRGDKSISGTPPPQNALRSLSSPWLEDGSVAYKSVAFPGAVLIFIKTFTRVPHPRRREIKCFFTLVMSAQNDYLFWIIYARARA